MTIKKTIYQYVDKIENEVKVPFIMWRDHEMVECDTCGNLFYIMMNGGASCTHCLNVEVSEERLEKFNWSSRYHTLRSIYGTEDTFILVSPQRELVRCVDCGSYRLIKNPNKDNRLECLCGNHEGFNPDSYKVGIPYIDANISVYTNKVKDNSLLLNTKKIDDKNYVFSIFGNRIECLTCPKPVSTQYQEVGNATRKILKCRNGCSVKEVNLSEIINVDNIRLKLDYTGDLGDLENVLSEKEFELYNRIQEYDTYAKIVRDWEWVKQALILLDLTKVGNTSVTDILIFDNPILDVVYNSY